MAMAGLSVIELEAHRNYQFRWNDHREEHFLVAGEQRDLQASLGALRATVCGVPWQVRQAETKAVADLFRSAGHLVPQGFSQMLSGHHGALRLHTEAVRLPWEIALPDRVVARQPASSPPRNSPAEGPVALWAGSTHPSVFSWSRPHQEACLRGWGGRTVADTGAGLLTESRAGVGYLVAGLSERGELVLEDLPVKLDTWVPRQSQKARTVCRCLFLHLVDHQAGDPYGRADGVAKAMLELGVESVVVTFWQPNLSLFPAALERFFTRLAQGGTVGEAYQELRESFPGDDGRFSRWAFGLYGQPDLAGSELVPLRVGSKQSATTVPRFGKADYGLKISAGPESGREVPIFSHTLGPGQRLLVGRPGLKRCQIEVNDPALATEAFAFEWEGVEAYLVNLSGAPEKVTLDGLPVHGRLPLKGVQTIRAGGSEFVFAPRGLPEAPPVSLAPAISSASGGGEGRYRLVVVAGVEQDQGRSHPVDGASLVVGREGAFVLHDPAVSREHVVVYEREGLFFLNHMGGADVILNGVPVEEESELRHGDRLILSSTTRLLFQDSRREVNA